MYQNNHLTHQYFPQPTRPMCFSHLPHLINSDGTQLPQPSSSVTFPDEERITTSTATTTSAVFSQEEPVVDELVIILLECLERVDTKFKKLLLRKVFSELEKEEKLESFIIERLEHSKVKAISELLEKYHESGVNLHNTMMRELVVDPTARKDLDGPVEESTPKLERFKVRPIKLSGIVKKEEGK
ncbi:hypothetical protein LguiA_005165 [Lonicera macranthoides]